MRRRVWQALKERCHSRGATVVLVTHNALEAEQVIERLAVLMNGRVIADGTPGEIKATIDERVRVELTFREPPDGRVLLLRALGELLRPAPNRMVLVAPRSEARRLIDGVLAAVSLDELDDFRILTPTLEDVYLQVAARQAGVQTPQRAGLQTPQQAGVRTPRERWER
jgi:ABC-2 type transport system ATP-binding protein